jgi:hypothetical protein
MLLPYSAPQRALLQWRRDARTEGRSHGMGSTCLLRHPTIQRRKEHDMKRIVIAAGALLMIAAQGALAAEKSADRPQATRMSQCSAEAKDKGLKGDARRQYMSECLRNPAARTAAKECGSAAAEKGLKGEQRKAFVNDCVKSKASAG